MKHLLFLFLAAILATAILACEPKAPEGGGGCGVESCPASGAESDACALTFGQANPFAIVCLDGDVWPDGNCKPLGHEASCPQSAPGGPVFCCGNNDSSSCAPPPKGCLPTFKGRCALAFGEELGSVQLCDPGAGIGMATCKSLSNYSAPLTLDCGAGPKEVWCCP